MATQRAAEPYRDHVDLTFVGQLDRHAALDAVAGLGPLVRAPEVAEAWQRESALPGMTIGGLTRHLVSQPECAVEFLGIPVPDAAPRLALLDYTTTWDWLDLPVDHEANTSIRDDVNAMGEAGPTDSVEVLDAAVARLPAALADAGPLTFVPWQEVAIPTDDFLVIRLMEVVVHADDLAVSVGLPTPTFPNPVIEPVTRLLTALALRRHDQAAVIRALSRAERGGPVSAF